MLNDTITYHGNFKAGKTDEGPDLPSTLGRFSNICPRAKGAHFASFSADDAVLGRSVSLIVPAPTPSPLQPFLDRARQFLPVRHPGILAVLDAVDVEGIGVIVTDPAPQGRLTDMQAERLDWFDAARLMTGVALAVAHAHGMGLTHGGLAPDHIGLTDQGQAIVSGWGLYPTANRDAADPYITWHHAPEQIVAPGQSMDARLDVYSMAAILYFLLCGREPFRSDRAEELHRKILEDAPQPPRQLVHSIPVALEQLCLQGLTKDRLRRTESAEAFARALARATESVDESTLINARSRSAVSDVSPETRYSNDWLIIHHSVVKGDAADGVSSAVDRVVIETLEASGAKPHRAADGSVMIRLPRREHEESVAALAAAQRGIELLSLVAAAVPRDDVAVRLCIESARSLDGNVEEEDRLAPTSLTHRTTRLEAEICRSEIAVPAKFVESINRYFRCSRDDNEPTWLSVASGNEAVTLRVPPRDSQPAMFGRESQLGILQARWHQACEGMGQTVMLIGDEGMGKTRLIEALLNWIGETSETETDVVIWRCLPRHRGTIFQPAAQYFADVLATGGRSPDEYLSRIGLADPDDADLLSSLLDLAHRQDLPAAQFRNRARDFFPRWLRALARSVPVLFVVEDLQWSDPATLDLLGEWINHGFHDRILTVTTLRPAFETPWGSRQNQLQVALNRLTRRQLSTMLAARLGEAPAPEVCAEVAEQTGRIPQFVEEFVERRLRSAGDCGQSHSAEDRARTTNSKDIE